MKNIIESRIFLLSETNKISLPIQICYADNEIEITLKHNGAEYCATGKDYLWVDAFANLQKKLPSGTLLACCMTCRHGNMCPYGNKENQLFCTKDIHIKSKEDMCNLFDHTNAEERSVASLDFCDDFVYQSDEYYTYNDYLYRLKITAKENNQ